MANIIAICSFLMILSGCAAQPGEFVPYYQVATQKPYDEVLAELEVAISENNFRVTGHSRVGKVIRERGAKDFPDYDTIQFCNLTHARTILAIAPEAIRHMPCNVVMYRKGDKTIVRTHLLPTDTDNEELNRFSEQMNRILKQMIDFAAEN